MSGFSFVTLEEYSHHCKYPSVSVVYSGSCMKFINILCRYSEKFISDDHMKKNEMGRTCSTYARRGQVHSGFWWGNLRQGDHF
jgi:hypothetical protein